MQAVCKICKETVTSPLVGLDRQKLEEDMAITLLNHMTLKHKPYMNGLGELSRLFNGFIVMNRFTIADEGMEDEKENMREKLAERVMQDSPEEEDFEEGDEDEPEENKKEREQEEERQNEINSGVEEARRRGQPEEVRRRKKTQETEETEEIKKVENQPIT